MEGEIDWRARYFELQNKVDTVITPLLVRALRYVPEDDVLNNFSSKREREEHPYANDIAPWESSYPLIMRIATPAEREKLYQSCLKKIRDGVWTGGSYGSVGHKRPTVGCATLRAREQQDAGLRPRHVRSNRKTSIQMPTINFPVTHCVLVGNGFYPKEGEVGSHLCHLSECVQLEHLVWESSDRNNRRENLCNKKKECRCGLEPACDFTLHK